MTYLCKQELVGITITYLLYSAKENKKTKMKYSYNQYVTLTGAPALIYVKMQTGNKYSNRQKYSYVDQVFCWLNIPDCILYHNILPI